VAATELVVALALAVTAGSPTDAQRAQAATLRQSDLGRGWSRKTVAAPRTPFRGCGTLRFPRPWPRPTASAGVAFTSSALFVTFTSQAYVFRHAAGAQLVARRVRKSQATASCWRAFRARGTRFVSARPLAVAGEPGVHVSSDTGGNATLSDYVTVVSGRTLVVLSFLGSAGTYGSRVALERATVERVRARIRA
jgi:hypothetical protein